MKISFIDINKSNKNISDYQRDHYYQPIPGASNQPANPSLYWPTRMDNRVRTNIGHLYCYWYS